MTFGLEQTAPPPPLRIRHVKIVSGEIKENKRRRSTEKMGKGLGIDIENNCSGE